MNKKYIYTHLFIFTYFRICMKLRPNINKFNKFITKANEAFMMMIQNME